MSTRLNKSVLGLRYIVDDHLPYEILNINMQNDAFFQSQMKEHLRKPEIIMM